MENEFFPKKYLIDGGEVIYVFDELLDGRKINKIYSQFLNRSYKLRFSNTGSVPHNLWRSELYISDLESLDLYDLQRKLMLKCFPNINFKFHRSICNLMTKDGYIPIHKDSAETKEVITVLYYANDIWKKNWGGETIFFNPNQEAKNCISVVPGRFIVFNGNIEHCAGGPNNFAQVNRFTLNTRYTIL